MSNPYLMNSDNFFSDICKSKGLDELLIAKENSEMYLSYMWKKEMYSLIDRKQKELQTINNYISQYKTELKNHLAVSQDIQDYIILKYLEPASEDLLNFD